ncbi:MAG: RNA 2',3'-cyclic phosphodiesterase [Acidobacteria bacterium]|nr:RNA 2',3'-cyclic phosphodiesterase [Acidobacteriota bacterium]
MDKKRLFLAVPLPDETKEILADVQEKLIPIFGKRGRTRPESMHLTLKFLGSVEARLAGKITDAACESLLETRPFRLKLNRLLAFGNPAAPRIVAVSLTPVEPIRRLAETVDSVCGKLGFQRETRLFTPHITVYRPKKPGTVNSVPFPAGISFPVSEVVLFQSELKPDGAVYRPLACFPLTGGPLSPSGADSKRLN